jgi:hypothetical protein
MAGRAVRGHGFNQLSETKAPATSHKYFDLQHCDAQAGCQPGLSSSDEAFVSLLLRIQEPLRQRGRRPGREWGIIRIFAFAATQIVC